MSSGVRSGIIVRLLEVETRIGEAWTRIPFRYGNACLTAVPILHLRAAVEDASGTVEHGLSADCLPPRWFDKDPAKDFRRNVEDLLKAIEIACRVYLEAGSPAGAAATAHDHWRRAYPGVLARCAAAGLNGLTGGFGSSLVERAIIDAVCRLAGVPFHRALTAGVLGIDAGAAVPGEPLASIFVRHTVGLGDAIEANEISASERLADGFPEALDEEIRRYGLRYFKVKVCGDGDRDLERLGRIAELLERECRDGYSISLDGNEQYRDLALLEELLARLRQSPAGRRFAESIIFIEQPLAREVALADGVREPVTRLSASYPVIIDESDDGLDAFARAAALGYRGCSIKNCKGVFKAITFRRQMLDPAGERDGAAGRDGERCFQTGEDLANLAVIPLQQDLTTLTSLGITHAERNGHHYFRGLLHLPPEEAQAALAAHGDLYGVTGGVAHLRIESGRIACASLHAPGYGYSCPIAFEARTPTAEWRFERLGLD